MVSSSIPIYEDGLEQSGAIYICEGGLVIKNNDKFIRAPFDYVKKLERFGEMPLGKISVIMKVFDQMGAEHDLAVAMSDVHYSSLLKLCPNAKIK